MTLTERTGPRPTTSDEGPYRQLDQQSPPELWGRLVHAATTLPGVAEGPSGVSVPSSRALLFEDLREVCALGWGEPHGYVEHDTEIVYGPRDDAELAVVLQLVEESLAYARNGNA